MRSTPLRWAIEPLRRYAAFSGRSSRSEFWWFWLLVTIVNTVMGEIDELAGSPVPSALATLAFVLPEVAVGARRLHDIGRSARWLLMPLAAVVLFVTAVVVPDTSYGILAESELFVYSTKVLTLLIVFATLFTMLGWFCKAGSVGHNDHGPDPLDPASHIVAVFS